MVRGDASEQARADQAQPGQCASPDRVHEGEPAGQGRASVSGDQAPVRVHESSLSGAGEEHRAVEDAVCAGQSVEGARAFDACDGTGAPMRRQRAPKGAPPAVCRTALFWG